MSDVLQDTYWMDEFRVTNADLERIAAYIRETGQAHDLTELAKRVVRGRLRFGPEHSTPAQLTLTTDPSVRLWDPTKEWEVGDYVVVAVMSVEGGRGRHKPYVGEVIEVGSETVRVQIDALGESRAYSTRAKYSNDDLYKWREFVRRLVEDQAEPQNIGGQVDQVIWKHGERVISQLLDALRADNRFVRLAGRWFLRELALPPAEEQLTSLAWGMVNLDDPQPIENLVSLVQPPLAEGDASLFGIYLAMRARPDLFANADPGQRPRWKLVGPPPGSFTPRHPAYDPNTYEILCLPNQPASPSDVKRLWELGLLRAVM
ncbi:hypothetical protein D6833_02355 [Candidatus Parcubacteria bacterium]|nr:MAG: hypothetical protein D6833_02355 [Candidatus Parcubacteria bacterium]